MGHIVNLLTEAKPEILLSFVLNLSNNPLLFILLGGIFVANSNFSWLRILMTLLFGVFSPQWHQWMKNLENSYLWICMGFL